MATATAAPIDVLADVMRERARAEAREVVAMLHFRDVESARIDSSGESPMRRLVERGAIALAIGEAMGFSEGQVQHRLSFADTVRDQSPTTWDAFVEGRVDLARVREIGHAIDQLKRTESVHRLDARVVEFAETHTVAELRDWLKRFVRRVEADLAIERAEAERANRHVTTRHEDDSMGFLGAHLASHELAAIADRLRREARRPADPGDERTVAQREADLLVAWLLDEEAAAGVVDANIGVTVDADVLAGANPGFAESTDGSWAVPDRPGQRRRPRARISRAFRPDDGPSGARQVPGRSPAATESLGRRGTSRAPHRVPWPHGPTRGDNLGPLCRRHHGYKGHGLLRWTTQP